MTWRDRWKGHAAVCIASGPSLRSRSYADVVAAVAWRDAAPDRHILVTNTTFREVPTADVIFGFDYRWWKMYYSEVCATCSGERVTITAENLPGVTRIDKKEFPNFGNSGTGQAALAIFAGCTDIALLGYDCQHGTGGEVHHHGNHPRGLGNALSMPRWPAQFQKLADFANVKQARIVNCTRRTALTCFARQPLEEFLNEDSHCAARVQTAG